MRSISLGTPSRILNPEGYELLKDIRQKAAPVQELHLKTEGYKLVTDVRQKEAFTQEHSNVIAELNDYLSVNEYHYIREMKTLLR